MAEERNVILVVVDLRWGITEEEGRTGKVLETCLGEIDNCTPYFIGISGSRYGWRPTIEELSRNPRLLQQYPWLEDDIRSGKSITEIEMLYGVLRRQGHVDASFFLKKSNHDEPDIITLKQTIRRYSPDYSFEFSSLDELGNLVDKEFLRILDSHYEKRPLLPHERMKLAQQAFLESKRTIYVPHEEDFDVLTSIADQPKNEGHVVDHQMGIANDDTNRVFDLTFFTDAIDNTGLPHVFEHATLSCSEKYPSAALFFNLSFQTYNTYMNASTSKRFTTYPVASLSEAQLLRFADYYTDSCFHPMIMENESIYRT
jgi:hypothetical protein